MVYFCPTAGISEKLLKVLFIITMVEHKVISSLYTTNKLCIYCDDITTFYPITGLGDCAR